MTQAFGTREAILRALIDNPIWMDSSRRRIRRGYARLRPCDVRGEQADICYGLVMRDDPIPITGPRAVRALGWDTATDDTLRTLLGSLVYNAVPFLWEPRLIQLAQSMPLPRHIVGPDLVPHDVMYWTSIDDLSVISDGIERPDLSLASWLIASLPGLGYLIGAVIAPDVRVVHSYAKAQMDLTFVPIGARYPEDVNGGQGETLLKLAAFIASPFISTKRHVERTSNGARRRGRPSDPVGVRVIALRSEVREAVAAERGERPAWKSRWLVRGHYRAQWYPSTRSHRVIWIAPYIKGPEGLPISDQLYAVVR